MVVPVAGNGTGRLDTMISASHTGGGDNLQSYMKYTIVFLFVLYLLVFILLCIFCVLLHCVVGFRCFYYVLSVCYIVLP